MTSRKELDKDILDDAKAIEADVCELEATPLTADAEAEGGSLVVKVLSRFAWREQMPSTIEKALPDPEPYEEPVEVTIELTTPDDGTSTFGDSKFTAKGSDGEVSWDQLPPGLYTITVSAPDGFALAVYTIAACGKAAGDDVDVLTKSPLITAVKVCDEETTTVEAFLIPLLSAVDVIPFFDRDRSGDPTGVGQLPITKLKASFRDGQKPLAANNLDDKDLTEAIKHLLGPSLSNTLANHPDRSRVYLLWKTGTVSVHTDPSVQVSASVSGAAAAQKKSLSLHSISPSTFAYLQRGTLAVANIPYEKSQAEIQVSAVLLEDLDCDPCCAPGKGKRSAKRTPLPNVTFDLYLGSPQGEPLREGITVGSAPHIFSDLDAGNYTIIASEWPKTFGGKTQIQPLNPTRGVLGPLSITAGTPAVIEFCFGPCLSRVTGLVTEGQAGTGVSAVPLTLVPSGGTKGTPYRATSDSNGDYEFNDVKAGAYVVRIEREKVYLSGGKTLEVPPSAQAGFPIAVPACGTVSVPVFTLDEDIHKIFGTATAPDGSILPFLRVEIQDKSGNVVAVTQTDANGYYEVILAQAGFYLVVPKVNRAPQIPVQVNSEQQVNFTAAPRGGPANQQAAASSAQVTESEIDMQAYPVLTEEVPSEVVQRPSGPSGGSGGTAPIGRLAENAIRDVLSWRAKADDPKSFMMALTQSFKLTEDEGHTSFVWTPRSYTVQTDMGAITGAQASIYTRAKVALDQSLPLLDGLYPLLPSLESEDMDSKRELVRSLFTELVNDFGIEGGPRVPRVDQLFAQLLGTPLPSNPEVAGGELGDLRERFGLERKFVTTIADEQDLTNYIVLVDYVIGLSNSWIAQKGYFTRNGGPEPFFGTQLVLLSRALDVVAQSVKDVYFAMDSVFLNAAERQTILLDFSNITGGSSLFVAELLDWVDRAASEELPGQLQDSGKDAIDSMAMTVQTLYQYVNAALLPAQPTNGLPPGYRTARVQRSLRELAVQLNDTYKLTSRIKAPQFPVF